MLEEQGESTAHQHLQRIHHDHLCMMTSTTHQQHKLWDL